MERTVRAKLSFARIGAQKARLVADAIRGKKVDDALRWLNFSTKKGAEVIKKLLESAIANAEQKATLDTSNLYIKTIQVNQGPVFRRYRPRAQGRAYEVRKKTSHIEIILAER